MIHLLQCKILFVYKKIKYEFFKKIFGEKTSPQPISIEDKSLSKNLEEAFDKVIEMQ